MLGLVPGGSESKLLPDLAAGRLVAFRLPDLADVLAFFAAFRFPDLADVPAFFAACRLPDLADVLAFFAAFRFPDLAAGRLVACRLPDLADVLAFSPPSGSPTWRTCRPSSPPSVLAIDCPFRLWLSRRSIRRSLGEPLAVAAQYSDPAVELNAPGRDAGQWL